MGIYASIWKAAGLAVAIAGSAGALAYLAYAKRSFYGSWEVDVVAQSLEEDALAIHFLDPSDDDYRCWGANVVREPGSIALTFVRGARGEPAPPVDAPLIPLSMFGPYVSIPLGPADFASGETYRIVVDGWVEKDIGSWSRDLSVQRMDAHE